MDELKKALSICLRGPEAERGLRRFRRQMKAWLLAMPGATPLVLDFGLGRFAETGLIECWIVNEARAGYCGKYLFVCGGQTCPEHRHRRKHETFFVVKGKVCLRCSGRDHLLSEGDALRVSPGRLHSFTGIGPALLLELSMPCKVDDNYFSDRGIPIGGNFKRRAPQ